MQNEIKRLLLPFVHGVNVIAIDNAVRLAQECKATLVVVALVPKSDQGRRVRLEHIQQSKDFLEAVQCRAQVYNVPLERYEVFTGDNLKSIRLVMTDLNCTGMILFTGGCALMCQAEVSALMKNMTYPLYMIQLPSRRKEHVLPLLQRISTAYQRKLTHDWGMTGEMPVRRELPRLEHMVRVIKLESLR